MALALTACGPADVSGPIQRLPLSASKAVADEREDLYRLFIVAFGAAPGEHYMGQLVAAADAGLSAQQIANILTTKPPFLERYPTSLSHVEFAQRWVDNVVGGSASSAAKANAVADIVAALSAPVNWSRGDVLFFSASNLARTSAADANWGAMARKLANQVIYARHFTEAMSSDTLIAAELRAVVEPVTENSVVEPVELTAMIRQQIQWAQAPMRWTVAFLPTDADFPNPDRGFYSSTSWDFLAEWDSEGVQRAWLAGRRLLMARVQLDDWRDTDLPPSLLALLSQRLEQVRAAGLKVTFLFNYDFSEVGQDASSERIRQHLSQLKPVLAAHADVIPFMRAGFIGAWGEWHSSASGSSCSGEAGTAACMAAQAHRMMVRDALLDNVPETTQLAFRYPADVMRWFPDPLQQRRLGLHNDCFLSGPSDTGTYDDESQRHYAAALTQRAAFGGETCENGELPLRSSCADILAEGARYHLAWLNADYAPSVVAGWAAQGCLARVSAFMGYRLQLDALTHAGKAAQGEELVFDVDLRNVGWSRLFTPRRLVVSLRHRETGAVWSASAGDLRDLPAQATSSSRLRVRMPLPSAARPGLHDVWLGVPDMFATTGSDPRYAVRFANADTPDGQQAWSSAQGQFRTGTTVNLR